jgi:protein SCO1
MRRVALAVMLAALSAAALAHHTEDGVPKIDYRAPQPGTYTLDRIMRAPDGRVLDTQSRVRRLAQFTRDRVTLLGFIYTTCSDPEGCPLAYRVFDSLKERVHASPALSGRVRFVTLSFDPARDTPSAMGQYAGSRVREEKGLSWYFLTTRSARDLMPLVEGFGQDVQVTVDRSSGRAVRELSHVLKVFLIDREGWIREIYNSTFLHPDVVMSDIETLLMER